MGFVQEHEALREIGFAPPTKFVLVCIAHHACQYCGLSRPGVVKLMLETGYGERAVREALGILKREQGEHGNARVLKIHAYPKGGRGVTTEYVVYPHLAKFSTSECPKCSSKAKTLHPVQGL